MSSSAGGGVGLVAGAAVVAVPVIAAVGAVAGVAAGTHYVVSKISQQWQEHDRLVELAARQAEAKRLRYQEYLAARARYQESAALLSGLGAQPGPAPAPADLTPESTTADLQAAIVEFQTAAAELRGEYESRALARQVAEMTQALAHTTTTQAHRADDALLRLAERLRTDRQADAARREQRIAELVARQRAQAEAAADREQVERAWRRMAAAVAGLPTDIAAGTRTRIEQRLAEIPQLRADRLEQAVSDLAALTDRARATAAVDAAARADAAAVLAALAGAETPAARELARRAQAVLDGTARWDPDLPGKARLELQRIEDQLADLAAAGALAAALAELGYQVGEDFTTTVLDRGGAFVHNLAWGEEHAVQVELDPDSDRVQLEVVREGDPAAASTRAQSARDVEIERSFCQDLPRLVDAAADNGLRIDIDRRIEPGEIELLRVADTGRRSRQREHGKRRLRERSRTGESDE